MATIANAVWLAGQVRQSGGTGKTPRSKCIGIMCCEGRWQGSRCRCRCALLLLLPRATSAQLFYSWAEHWDCLSYGSCQIVIICLFIYHHTPLQLKMIGMNCSLKLLLPTHLHIRSCPHRLINGRLIWGNRAFMKRCIISTRIAGTSSLSFHHFLTNMKWMCNGA